MTSTGNNQPTDYLSLSVRDFAAATAAKQPTPGGGSVAAATGMLATALAEMTLNFTRGKKKFAPHEAFHAHLSDRLTRTRKMFEDLLADDVSAYGLYREAAAMDDGPAKDQAMALALAAAINVPRETAKLALSLMDDLVSLSDKCNRHLVSDLAAAAALAVSTVQLCDYNVRINVPQLSDTDAAGQLRAASRGDLDRAKELHAAIEASARAELG